jgi:hypothetical protein
MKATIRKNSELNDWSLYCLEDIFGYSSGHGCGLDGEDIEWKVNNSKRLIIIQYYNQLEIKYISYDEEYNEQEYPLTSLPIKWKNKLLKILKEHTHTQR